MKPRPERRGVRDMIVAVCLSIPDAVKSNRVTLRPLQKLSDMLRTIDLLSTLSREHRFKMFTLL